METSDVILMAVALCLIVVLPVALGVRLVGALFSRASWERVKKHPVIHIVWFVVSVLAILNVAVVPQLKVRNSARRGGCINNLRMIADAKDSYALEYGGTNDMVLTASTLTIYIMNITNKCICPSAIGTQRTFEASYDIGVLGERPKCKICPTNADGSPNHDMFYRPKCE